MLPLHDGHFSQCSENETPAEPKQPNWMLEHSDLTTKLHHQIRLPYRNYHLTSDTGNQPFLLCWGRFRFAFYCNFCFLIKFGSFVALLQSFFLPHFQPNTPREITFRLGKKTPSKKDARYITSLNCKNENCLPNGKIKCLATYCLRREERRTKTKLKLVQ